MTRPRAAPTTIQTSQSAKATRIRVIGVSHDTEPTSRASSGMPKAVTTWKPENPTAIQNSSRPVQPSPKVAGRPCSGSWGGRGRARRAGDVWNRERSRLVLAHLAILVAAR